jgi:putative transposase
MEYQRDEHRVHRSVYPLLCCPKRRKPGLVGDVAKDCRKQIAAKCQDKGWTILQLAIQPDPIHRFARIWPGDSAAEALQACKGLTAHPQRNKHKDLLKLPSLGTRSYCASTAGNISAQTIQRSIEMEKGI